MPAADEARAGRRGPWSELSECALVGEVLTVGDRTDEIVTVVPGFEAVRLYCLGSVPPGLGSIDVVGDVAETSEEAGRWVAADLAEVPGHERVGGAFDVGQAVNLGLVAGGERLVVVGLGS